MLNQLEFTNGMQMPIGAMYGVGQNYAAHAKEMGGQEYSIPILFIKPPSAYIPSGSVFKIPNYSNNVHYECELVVVIGKECLNVKEEDAHNYIAGYAVGLDITLRDLQLKAKNEGLPWAIAKGFADSAPISKVVPFNQFEENYPIFEIELKINNEVKQRAKTDDFITPVNKLIEILSGIFSLQPGDCIFTGTPSGVGPIHSGDKLHAELKGYVDLDIEAV